MSILLGERNRLDMVYLETIRHDNSSMSESSGLGVGSWLPLLSSSMGRAYLASLPTARHERLREALRTQQLVQWATGGTATDDVVKAGIHNDYAASLHD